MDPEGKNVISDCCKSSRRNSSLCSAERRHNERRNAELTDGVGTLTKQNITTTATVAAQLPACTRQDTLRCVHILLSSLLTSASRRTATGTVCRL
jgi:hypothetical protein